MKQFDDYFSKEFKILKPKIKEIGTLLSDEMMLISGDFYGIQKFIFEGLATKNAAKVLRAKSAFVQLFTMMLSKYICNKLAIDEKYILTQNAGKFEILSPKLDQNTLDEIQKGINEYFIKYYYGLSGVTVCGIQCSKVDFSTKENYQKLRKVVADLVAVNKFHKFSLLEQNPVLEYDTTIDNQSLCKVCHMRKTLSSKSECEICDRFISLGQNLTTYRVDELVSSDLLGLKFDGFVCNLVVDEKIKSYVCTNKEHEISDFETLSQEAQGTKALAILKADVDGMGNFIKNSSVTESFETFDMFSKTLDNFFSLHIPRHMAKRFKNTYTVFAGGDDLFLVGSWDVILDLARWIEEEFKKFVKSKELTISFGIAIAKPSTPISYLAEHTEHLLETAKALDGKDAISLFGETVKWDSYKEIFQKLDSEFSKLKDDDINTAFLYRLLEFCEMSKHIKYRTPDFNIIDTMWKSKLRYSFSRNNSKLGETFFGVLDNAIENNPSETKMFLSEFIYKRRD